MYICITFKIKCIGFFFCFRSVVEPCDTSGCQIHLKWEILIKIQQNLQSNINITKCWKETPPPPANKFYIRHWFRLIIYVKCGVIK